MRMFVAVRPPEPVLESLAAFVEPRRSEESALRWTEPESWHITLAFMADVPDADLDELLERLSDTAAAATGFELSLADAGAFPNPNRAKLLWTGVAGAVPLLAHLAANVRSACNRAGITTAGGDYRPHLTLARIGRPLNVTRWLQVFALYRSEPWLVRELVLYESSPGGGTHRYRPVAEFPLRA
ncbi:MAG TPA: RNA 2',3'-cyclic phosphodiesterase [Jatrophihabitans sp.]|nr:RNA 2',3'-cyclic phosphodiesterase [Jatrophihabitans sp.]